MLKWVGDPKPLNECVYLVIKSMLVSVRGCLLSKCWLGGKLRGVASCSKQVRTFSAHNHKTPFCFSDWQSWLTAQHSVPKSCLLLIRNNRCDVVLESQRSTISFFLKFYCCVLEACGLNGSFSVQAFRACAWDVVASSGRKEDCKCQFLYRLGPEIISGLPPP